MGKTLADLQSNISISAENAVSGTLLWVDDYTGFSGDPAEQSGNYIALKISAEALGEALEGATITATYHGRTVNLDSDQIIIVRQAEGEDTITFTANKEGYTEGRLTLDFSGLTLTPEPAKFSLVCNTPGITFAPSGTMAGGTATFEITATGQVPYDTTTSSNLINMTLTTNASPDYDQTDDSILVAYLDSEETAHTLYTGSLTWSDDVGTATFNCPITADSITYSPIIAIVVDGTNATRVSQVLDTSALTLEPIPAPRFSITNTTQTATLTTDGVMSEDGVDAILGGSLPVDENTITTPGDAYPNRFNFTITTNNQGYFQAGDVIQIRGGANTQPYLTRLKQDYSLTFNEGVGTANISLPIRPMSYSSANKLWDDNSSSTQFSITIIRPGPDYPTTASDFTTIITRKVRYHHYLKFTPYRATPPVQLSNITYEGINYNSSDFVSGGTIEICSALQELGVIIKNMHFKWVNLQGTDNEYYLPLMATSDWLYRAFNAADTDGYMSGFFTGKFGNKSATKPLYTISGYDAGHTSSASGLILTPILVGVNLEAINAGYVSGLASCKQRTSSTSTSITGGSWYITFENCTFDTPADLVNITTNEGTTEYEFTPSTASTTKVATGTVPYQAMFAGAYMQYTIGFDDMTSSGPYKLEIYANTDLSNPITTESRVPATGASLSIKGTLVPTGTGAYLQYKVYDSNNVLVKVIKLDTSALTIESAPAPSSPYTVLGTEMTLSPTDTIDASLGFTVAAEDIMDTVYLDSTTAGTQADPWIANINVIPYNQWYQYYYILAVSLNIPSGTTYIGAQIDSGQHARGILNIFAQNSPTTGAPTTSMLTSNAPSDSTTSGTCMVEITYTINNNQVKKYVNFTITNN